MAPSTAKHPEIDVQIAWYWEWKELFEVTEVKLKDLGVKITKGM
jgi:hypothetical protein